MNTAPVCEPARRLARESGAVQTLRVPFQRPGTWQRGQQRAGGRAVADVTARSSDIDRHAELSEVGGSLAEPAASSSQADVYLAAQRPDAYSGCGRPRPPLTADHVPRNPPLGADDVERPRLTSSKVAATCIGPVIVCMSR